MNEAKNLACPFCKCPVIKAQAIMLKGYPAGYNAMCDNCESTGPYSETPEGALEKWNDRAGGRQPEPSKTPEPSTLASATCCAALIEWLKTEILEDEGAMINARDHGEWDRYHRLDGHRGGFVHVIHHIRAAQHNTARTNPHRHRTSEEIIADQQTTTKKET